MPLINIKRRRSARVRTSSNPTQMGVCFSNLKENVKNVDKIVRVEEGILEGVYMETAEGFKCDVFLGIPYAKPPVDELRFQKPQTSEPWSGVRKCNKFPNRSIHKEMPWDKALSTTPQSEDCLYLNVHAPQIREDKKYPVMFYIHGGGFVMDSAERYTAKNICRLLVSRDIIVVTCHYRLGYLGFLSTGDDVCPGNFGLYDMLAALKWTHKNIASFGGDPNNITLSGQSAGGASADLLSFSPLAKGLFKRKIVMGGNSYCHWAVQKKSVVREYCREKALKLGWKPQDHYNCQRDESIDILNFYKGVSPSKLGTTMFFSKTIFTECRLPLAPVIDGDILPYNLRHLRDTQEHVPSIVGGGEHEALLFCAIGLLRGTEKEVDNAIQVITKKTGIPQTIVREMISKVYGDYGNSSKKRQQFYVELVSDIFVNYANNRFVKDQQARGVECYAYSFDHQSKQLWGWLRHAVPFTGGTHTSELTYLFDCNYMSSPLGMTKTDKYISQITGEYFTNFVKFGSPNGNSSQSLQWEPFSKSETVFSFKPEPEMKSTQYSRRMERLAEIVEKMYEEPSTAPVTPTLTQLDSKKSTI